jgi:hypothetical protein
MRPGRRQFIQAGAAGAALLALVAFIDRPRAQSRDKLRNLDARGVELLEALIPVVLAGALPAGSERKAAVAETVEAFDRALSGLEPAIQEEIAQMLSLLLYAPTRIAVAGMRPPWREASPGEIAAFLRDWRDSFFDLKRSGYRALTQLIQAAWYGNARAWPAVAYPGPPTGPVA